MTAFRLGERVRVKTVVNGFPVNADWLAFLVSLQPSLCGTVKVVSQHEYMVQLDKPNAATRTILIGFSVWEIQGE